MREYENDMFHNKDKERLQVSHKKFKLFKNQKITDLEKDKKYLEGLEYQQYMDIQRKKDQKVRMKNENQKDLDIYHQKKHVENN